MYGKGQGIRRFKPRSIPVADSDHQQVFYFDFDWQAWECEIELIAFFGRKSDGGMLLNKSTGGPGGNTGVRASEKTRSKMSAAKTGKKRSAETRAKISAAKKGVKSPMYGKKHTEETLQKMRDAKQRQKHTHSEETKLKISEIKKQWWADKKKSK